MNIYEALTDLINDNITALNGKIQPVGVDLPQPPYCTYQTVSNVPTNTHDGYTNGTSEEIQFDIYAKTYTELISLKTGLISLLCNLNGTYSGVFIQAVTVLNDFDGYEENTQLKRRTIEFEFYY